MQEYQKEYEAFIADYKIGQASAEAVGELIARMAQYYGEKNNLLALAHETKSKKAAEVFNSEDQATGKPLTIGKAEVMVDATEEYAIYNKAKTDLQNIEQYINALKSLQKGLLQEYSHMGNI
jgi:hypothetical protein